MAIDSPGRTVDQVDFAVDGVGVHTEQQAPFELDLDTRKLADGPHQLAVNVSLRRRRHGNRRLERHGRERAEAAARNSRRAGRAYRS